jgi:LDH2 family malate/lactate/ureidoglycolate dehydrogenase
MSCGGLTPAYRMEELLGFATALFRRAGLDSDKAGTVAEILVEGDLLGHTTHGLALAAPYLAALDAGSITRKGDPVVVSDRGGAMCWDGRRLPGPWLVVRAIEQALARFPEHGGAAVAIRESHHIGCLAAYVERATSKDCMVLFPAPIRPGEHRPVRRRAGLVHARSHRGRDPDPWRPDPDRYERIDHDQWHDGATAQGG